MTSEERIRSEIEVWENAAIVYANALAECEKYGDYGGRQYNEHMIEYCRIRAKKLDVDLQQLKSA
ncbi:hypothetical protein [Paenibacillus sp. FSL R10-2771]|uniref:hypothetical protein n=1 Tax=Paenibacillus sp. FSL R10-2771 TaxID=2954693 RepID=UPI0030FABD6B